MAQVEDFYQPVIQNKIPLRRFGQSEEVTQAILFLSGPHGSYITGANLVIDGGLMVCWGKGWMNWTFWKKKYRTDAMLEICKFQINGLLDAGEVWKKLKNLNIFCVEINLWFEF